MAVAETAESEVTGQVWDLPVRLAHWSLVLVLAGSWLTAELGVEYREYHFWCGYSALGIVVFRVLWGIVGTRYARFAQFLPTLNALRDYVASFTSKPSATPHYVGHKYVGHNPLGALSIIAMLALVLVQAGTGLFTDDDILYTGPYHAAVSSALAKQLAGIHHSNFDYLLAMLGLHVVAIVFYKFKRRENLTKAMVTGHKPLVYFHSEAPLDGSKWVRALCVALIAAGLIWLLLDLAPEPVYDDYY